MPVSRDLLCPSSRREWLAKAGHVPAGFIPGGRVVVAIRTQLVDPSALLIWENSWLASHEHLSASPALGFMVSHSWEPDRRWEQTLLLKPVSSAFHQARVWL